MTNTTSASWKKWVKRLLIGLLALLFAFALALLWLFNSTSGARFALRFAPPGLSVGALRGSLSGPLMLENVRFAQPGLAVELKAGALDLRWRALLDDRLVLDGLTLDGLQIVLSDAPTVQPAAPSSNTSAHLLLLQNVKLRSVKVSRVTGSAAAGNLVAETLADLQEGSAKLLSLEGETLTLEGLDIREARGTLRADGSLDLRASATSTLRFSAAASDSPLALSGTLSGTPALLKLGATLSTAAGESMQADAPSAAPDTVRFEGELSDINSTARRWRGTLQSSGLELAPLMQALRELQGASKTSGDAPQRSDDGQAASLPVKRAVFSLTGEGASTQAKLAGSVQLDQDPFVIRAVDLDWSDAATLAVNALDLDLPSGGNVRASGRWPLLQNAPAGALKLEWRALSLPQRFGWPAGLRSDDGSLRVSGRSDDAAAEFDIALAQLELANPAKLPLSGRLSGSVQRKANAQSDTLTLAPLRLGNQDGGFFIANGTLRLPMAEAKTPLSWQLELNAEQLNPALVAPDWPGALALTANTQGVLRGGKPVASFAISTLSGQLKNQPISGKGALKFAESFQPTGDLTLRWGANSADFDALPGGDVQANLEIAALGELVPSASGSLEGNFKVQVVDAAFALEGALTGRLLKIAGFEAETLDAQVAIPAATSAPIALKIQGVNVNTAGQLLRTVNATADGTRGAHTLALALAHAKGALSLDAAGGLTPAAATRPAGWSGTLNRLTLRPAQVQRSAGGPASAAAPELSLQAPALLRLSATNVELERACLQGAGVALCTALSWANVGPGALSLALDELDLAALEAALGGLVDSVQLRGVLAGSLDAKLSSGALVGLNAKLAPLAGKGLIATVQRPDAEEVTLRFSDFSVATAAPNAQPVDALPALDLRIALEDAGTLEARNLQIGQQLNGQIRVALTSLTAFSGLSESVVNLSGSLLGDLTLAGTAAAPIIRGDLSASALGMELPAAGLKLSNGQIRLRSDGARFDVDGAMQSGKGTLRVVGWLAPFDEKKAELSFQGTDVLLADIPSALVIASPDLTVAHEGALIRIKGTLRLPKANLALDRFESGVTRSGDVAVLDDLKAVPGTPVRADVTVTLGEDVTLKGFGLNGKLTGQLRVRERPNKQGTARGEIEVKGTYKAYGQDLLIERGKLLFSSTPLDDPGLDIRALRKVDKTKAGVQVRGTALRPELTVWSDPVMEQYDVLSMIVTGQTLRGASSDQKSLVANAGGNFLAQGIGKKVGLELGVETLSDVGGPAFTAGKYLSPALYVGYGQGLFNPQTVFILRYRLFESYELEGLSGREQKVGVNYRREK